jgi:hypothetical protein
VGGQNPSVSVGLAGQVNFPAQVAKIPEGVKGWTLERCRRRETFRVRAELVGHLPGHHTVITLATEIRIQIGMYFAPPQPLITNIGPGHVFGGKVSGGVPGTPG